MTNRHQTKAEKLQSLKAKFETAMAIKHSNSATPKQKAEAERAMKMLILLRDGLTKPQKGNNA